MICKIRKWDLADAADLAAALSNRKVQDNLRDGLPYPYTEQDGVDFISAMLYADKNETFAFAITADGRVAGSIGVFRQGNIHRRTAEMGYYIAEEYWGKGLMTEAVKQVCEHVFEKSDILRIYAEPFAYNTASCRVLEKAGFQCEGTLRKNAVKNGKVIDMKMYSLLKEDFYKDLDMQLKRAECPAKVAEIVEKTIRAFYPHYYPSGAVQFFLDLHSERKIREALAGEEIYIAEVQGEIVGTGSIRGNEICRLFILPEYQAKGYGSRLMDFLEDMVFGKYHAVHIDASFPAESMYLKRGYRIKTYEKIETAGGDYLCYHTMEKAAVGKGEGQ